MRITFIISILFLWFTDSSYAQSSEKETTPKKFKYSIGARYSMLHLIGDVKGDIELSKSPERILISKMDNADPGFFVSSESRFSGQKNLFKQIEIGFSKFSGKIEYREVGGSTTTIDGKRYELQRYKNFEFSEFHFYTSYQIKTHVKNMFSIAFGAQISGRLRKEIINGIGERSLFNSDLSMEQNEAYTNRFNIDSDDNSVIAQIYLTSELGKSFSIKQAHFSTGVNYTRGLMNFHNAGNTKISVLSMFLKYYL